MSWSFAAVGKPDAIMRAIDKCVSTYSNESREEFDAAAPHLKALVCENMGEGVIVNVSASGHANFKIEPGKKEKVYGSLSVSIAPFCGFVE